MSAEAEGKTEEKPKEKAEEKGEEKKAGGFRKISETIKKPKKEKKEEVITEKKLYIIPLRNVKKTSRLRRAKRAVSDIKLFLRRHMKTENVKISRDLNEYLWSRGIRSPPGKIKIMALRSEEKVTAELAK